MDIKEFPSCIQEFIKLRVQKPNIVDEWRNVGYNHLLKWIMDNKDWLEGNDLLKVKFKFCNAYFYVAGTFLVIARKDQTPLQTFVYNQFYHNS